MPTSKVTINLGNFVWTMDVGSCKFEKFIVG